MKYTLLDKSFQALYQNLDDIKAIRIQRAMDTTWMPIMWPLKSCMPIGAFLLLVQGISEVFKTYYAFVKGRWP